MSQSTAPTTPARTLSPRALAGWALTLALIGYAIFAHHGLGPFPDRALEIWSPREFLIRQSWIVFFEENLAIGVVAFMLPAILGTVGVFLLSRSSLARAIAVSTAIASGLFAYYGLGERGPGIWNFFHWRGSAVMAGMALVLGATATAPLLARSWLRLPVAARVAVYLPIVVGVVMLLRNVTGTDESLRFAISPWPVVPLFGIKFGSVAILGVLLGMVCGAWSSATGDPERQASAARRGLGLLVALLLPALWFKLWHGTFPARGMIGLTVVAAPFVLVAALVGRPEGRALRSRHLAWGFLLAALPLVVGKVWAGSDYTRTREGSARIVIDALDGYHQKHDEYPDDLDQLIEGEYLASIPRPSIGFGFIEDQEFQYQSFGNSYNLEFSSPDWVQCAYNPSWSEDGWDDEDFDDEEEEDVVDGATGDGETSLGEAWSCPSSPPELW